jgi:hypothetical protein|tara:strand:- start:240 stop:653 length:414 start_codon:yes stop_codon:yes gene_type:complete
MADQDFIRDLSEQLSMRIVDLQKEVIESVLTMVNGKTNTEALTIVNSLNMDNIINLKAQSMLNELKQGLIQVLEKKELFADMEEETLKVFFDTTSEEVVGELLSMGNVLRKEINNAIINQKTTDDILDNINRQGYGV